MAVDVIRVGSTLPLTQRTDTNRFTRPAVLQNGMLMLMNKRGVVAISCISVFHEEQCNYDLNFPLTWGRANITEAIQQWLQAFGGAIEEVGEAFSQASPKSKILRLIFVGFSCRSLVQLGDDYRSSRALRPSHSSQSSSALLLPVLHVALSHQISFEERIPLL